MRVRSAERAARLRARRRLVWIVVSVVVAAVLIGAAAVMSRAASPRDPAAAVSASGPARLADRTLVPRRIRLIIGYTRPRLA